MFKRLLILKRSLVVVLIIFLLAICLSLISLYSVSKLREFLYREISYQFTADRVVGNEKNKEKIALLLFDYIHHNLNLAGGKVSDQDSWNDLVRGIAWCDQQSWAFATLLSKKNIDARFAMLKNKNGVSPHTVAEVFLDGKWRVFDPMDGLVFRKKDGSLVSLEEISQDLTIISQNPRVKSLDGEHYDNFITWYKQMFPIPQEPVRWSSLLKKKTKTLPRRLVHRGVMTAVRLLGKPFVNLYQNLYLSKKSKSFSDPKEALYYKTRNYHLYQRTNLAEKTYKQIIQDYPQNQRAEDSQYYLGVLLFENGNSTTAIQRLNNLITNSPNTRWANLAHYFLGRAYEDLGDLQNAIMNYKYASTNLATDASWRLSRLN